MPDLIVLGTAQDGGLPHAGCACASCVRARREPGFRRLPAAIGLVAGGASILVDATKDFAEQIHALWLHATGGVPNERGRFAAPGTILLTHAHTGHYVGLWQLDRSVLSAAGVRVMGPPETIALLSTNEPWREMVREGFITLEPLRFDEDCELPGELTATPILVPHRSEWHTDTVAYRFDGPERSALYLPDIDAWDQWGYDIADIVADVDVALLDGTFWEPFPMPGVPHPPAQETLDRLQPVADAGQSTILFTHLNHTNPLVDPNSAESHEVRARGFRVAREGDVFRL